MVRLVRLATSSGEEAWQRIERDLEGAPTMTQWPPKPDLVSRGVGPEPFNQLWRSDVGGMIEKARAANVKVILMTYPNYDEPPLAEIEAMAAKFSLPLVENHKSFKPYLDEGRPLEVFFEDIRHPNAVGYGIVVDNILRCILERDLLAPVLPASAVVPAAAPETASRAYSPVAAGSTSKVRRPTGWPSRSWNHATWSRIRSISRS